MRVQRVVQLALGCSLLAQTARRLHARCMLLASLREKGRSLTRDRIDKNPRVFKEMIKGKRERKNNYVFYLVIAAVGFLDLEAPTTRVNQKMVISALNFLLSYVLFNLVNIVLDEYF